MLADLSVNAVAAPTSDQPALRLLRKYLPMCKLAASRGGAILAQFAAQLAVGSMAGASALGVLQLFTSWTCIAGEILGLGLPTRAMRLVSVAYAEQQGDVIRQLLREARRKIIRLWFLLVLLAAVPLALLLGGETAPDWTHYSWLLIGAALAAPFFSLLRLYAESLKATGAAMAAVTLESLTSPMALLLVCAVCWLTGQALITITLLIAFSLSLVVTPLALHSKLRQQLALLPPGASLHGKVKSSSAATRGELLSLWGIGVLSIGFLHLPFIVLPFYADAAQIGVFAVAHKLINVVTTLLLLLAAVFGPAFARQAAQYDAAGMLSLLRRTQLISTAVFLPVSLTLIALANPLGRLFGEDFGDLRIYLVILTAGHLINAATGLAGVLLNMAGAASKELSTLVIAMIFALGASAWVGPEFGAIGLACVFSGSIALKNIASYALARNHLLTTREQS
jgi:O-antigen/teichoic acid export membrane protein